MGFLPSNQPFNNSDVHFSTLPDLGHDFLAGLMILTKNIAIVGIRRIGEQSDSFVKHDTII
jgi:hypothetical protein